GTTTDAPKDPAAGVSLSSDGGTTVTVVPPDANSAGDGQVVAPGVVAYPNDNGSATAVQADGDGSTRFITVIADAGAPTSYQFGITVPGGGRVELAGDGGATVLDANDQLVVSVATPWAKDANGTAVPTHFETD